MSVIYKVSRLLQRSNTFNKNVTKTIIDDSVRLFQTSARLAKPKSVVKMSLIGASVGALVGAGYSVNKINKDRENISNEGTQTEIEILERMPDIKPSRKVI